MARKTAAQLLANEAADDAEAMRVVFRYIGRALAQTILAATIPRGDLNEKKAIEAMDIYWTELADKIIEFAMKD